MSSISCVSFKITFVSSFFPSIYIPTWRPLRLQATTAKSSITLSLSSSPLSNASVRDFLVSLLTDNCCLFITSSKKTRLDSPPWDWEVWVFYLCWRRSNVFVRSWWIYLSKFNCPSVVFTSSIVKLWIIIIVLTILFNLVLYIIILI